MSEIKLSITEHEALKIAGWLVNRGGVSVWKSANLSNPSGQWLTPYHSETGELISKPTWEARSQPDAIFSPFEIEVRKDVLFSTIRVALRRACLSLKLTDSSKTRMDAALETCRAKHGQCTWSRGDQDLDYPHISIYYPVISQTLDEYFKDEAGKALNEIIESYDAEIKHEQSDFVIGETQVPTKHAYCVGKSCEPEAGIIEQEFTPWFNDRVTLAIYCLVNKERLIAEAKALEA